MCWSTAHCVVSRLNSGSQPSTVESLGPVPFLVLCGWTVHLVQVERACQSDTVLCQQNMQIWLVSRSIKLVLVEPDCRFRLNLLVIRTACWVKIERGGSSPFELNAARQSSILRCVMALGGAIQVACLPIAYWLALA